MKQRTKMSMAIAVIVMLSAIVAYLVTSPPREVIAVVPTRDPEFRKPRAVAPTREPEIHQPRAVAPTRDPEFRKPPLKEYKPGHVQQMGLLLGEDGETLPLYGKEVRGRRDRYHYYTSTPGQQIYALPVTHENRDCMDDMGCQELYGQEKVNVLGKAASYEVKLYRTENFFV